MSPIEHALPQRQRPSFAQPHRVIVFTRYPEAGVTKTRLIPALGPERAAEVQTQLTKRTLETALRHGGEAHCDIEVRFAGGDRPLMEALFGNTAQYRRQDEGDLGQRLEKACQTAFAEGAESVLVIGSDCPDLNCQILSQAQAALTEADVVIGPALDGGYYLIGLRAAAPTLFSDVDWGTEHVLAQTIEKTNAAGLTMKRLPALSDVDEPEDLLVLRRLGDDFANVLPPARLGRISIVVPTFNEASQIAATLEPLLCIDDVEVIVADGGSEDDTVGIASRLVAERMKAGLVEAKVFRAGRGRGRQMNAGAALASGDVLLFLHADSRLPEDFPRQVRRVLERGAIAGAFRLEIDSHRFGLRWIEKAVNLRSRLLQLPYGDQAIFVGAERFYRIGGFPNWPLMEDVELCRRLRREGTIGQARSSIQTSARRWDKLGIFRTTLTNLTCLTAYHLGIPPQTLNRWYHKKGDGGLF